MSGRAYTYRNFLRKSETRGLKKRLDKASTGRPCETSQGHASDPFSKEMGQVNFRVSECWIVYVNSTIALRSLDLKRIDLTLLLAFFLLHFPLVVLNLSCT